ncbi:hypothetical protein ACWEWI_27635 [Streptomyces sp. NPDC003753]
MDKHFSIIRHTEPSGRVVEATICNLTADDVQDWVRAEEAGEPDPKDPQKWKRRKSHPKSIANRHGLLSSIVQVAVEAEPPLRSKKSRTWRRPTRTPRRLRTEVEPKPRTGDRARRVRELHQHDDSSPGLPHAPHFVGRTGNGLSASGLSMRCMYQITLKCSCGRVMSPDGHSGRGAFRCGCGRDPVHVIEQSSPVRRCTYGTCRTLATTREPLRFCSEHELEAASRLGHLAGTLVLERYLERSPRTRARRYGVALTPMPKSLHHAPVVYFAIAPTYTAGGPARSRPIKIGTTTQLRKRMRAIPAVPLAVEPGDVVREAQLHRRFAELRQNGEWFRPAAELVVYINELRAADGLELLPR